MKVVAVLMVLVVSCHAHPCPLFWHQFQGHCYRYFGDRMTWAQAETSCHAHFTSGGMARLTSIHSEEENAFVYELFRSSAGDTPDWVHDSTNPYPVHGVWIGLHQETSDGPWVYTDGSAAAYSKWKSGEPNDSYYGGEDGDCVHIWRRNDDSDELQQWNDMYCDEVMSFVCKMPRELSHHD